MNILVTSYSGFSGHYIANHFAGLGYKVFAISRKNIETFNGVQLIQSSLQDLQELPSVDIIIHTAALSPTPYNHYSTADLLRNNVLATQNLIKLAEATNVQKIIFFSTLSIYGEIHTDIVTEESPILNPNIYGISKWLGEKLLQNTKIPTLSLRLPAIMGKKANYNWITETVKKALHNQLISFYNPQSSFNNAIHIHELSCFIEKLLTHSWQGSDSINLASAGSMTIQDTIHTIITKISSSSPTEQQSQNKNSFLISTLKAEKIYGYKPILFQNALGLYLNDVLERSNIGQKSLE